MGRVLVKIGRAVVVTDVRSSLDGAEAATFATHGGYCD